MMFSFDQTELIWDNIERKIYQERLRYEKLYDVIDEYVSIFNKENYEAILVGGTMGIDLLLKRRRGYDDFSYVLYSENAFLHANNLINKIEQTNEEEKMDFIIFLKTVIPNIKYIIIIDSRVMVSIYRLYENSYKIIRPIKVKTFDQRREILAVPPEIQLIEVYRTLYSPNKADDWEDTLDNETKLFNMLRFVHEPHTKFMSSEYYFASKEGEKKYAEVKPEASNNLSNKELGGDSSFEKNRNLLVLKILQNFVMNNPNIVLIGDYALKIISNISPQNFVLQIISENDIEKDFFEIKEIIQKTIGIIPIIKLTRNLYIIQDFRIRRTTIKVGEEDNQKELMYIYNTAQFDLIPFNKSIKVNIHKNHSNTNSFMQLGSPFVLLRFFLIDFWMLRLIQNLGAINREFAETRLNAVVEKVVKFRSTISGKELTKKGKIFSIDDKFFDASNLLRIFASRSEDYLGNYIDEAISQKIFAKGLKKKYAEYFPREYKKINGKFRELTEKETKEKDENGEEIEETVNNK